MNHKFVWVAIAEADAVCAWKKRIFSSIKGSHHAQAF